MLYNLPEKLEFDHVKFISYSGKYPNLCSGELILELDGEQHSFKAWPKETKYHHWCFWSSGGSCTCGGSPGPWRINYNDLPDEFKPYALEIDYLFNANVKPGCCGGCV